MPEPQFTDDEVLAALRRFGDRTMTYVVRNVLVSHHGKRDGPLLEAVYKAAGAACPWHWSAVRCTRTLYDLACIDRRLYDVPPPHIALNDAIAQTRAANAALLKLSKAHEVAA